MVRAIGPFPQGDTELRSSTSVFVATGVLCAIAVVGCSTPSGVWDAGVLAPDMACDIRIKLQVVDENHRPVRDAEVWVDDGEQTKALRITADGYATRTERGDLDRRSLCARSLLRTWRGRLGKAIQEEGGPEPRSTRHRPERRDTGCLAEATDQSGGQLGGKEDEGSCGHDSGAAEGYISGNELNGMLGFRYDVDCSGDMEGAGGLLRSFVEKGAAGLAQGWIHG
jgi:hypothetical protein